MCAKNRVNIFSSFLDMQQNVEWPRFFGPPCSAVLLLVVILNTWAQVEITPLAIRKTHMLYFKNIIHDCGTLQISYQRVYLSVRPRLSLVDQVICLIDALNKTN